MWSPLLSSSPGGTYFQGEHTESISQSHHFVKQKKHKVVTFLVKGIGAWQWLREGFPASAGELHHPGSVAWAKRTL
jgi:hypothetical protein